MTINGNGDGGELIENQEGVTAPQRTPLFSLLAANAVSQIGNMVTNLAVPWFVLQTTGSAAKTGLTGAALALGAVVAPILGGPLVDRLGFKRTSVLADIASGMTISLIPVLYLLGVLQFWQLPIIVFVLASLNTTGDSGRYAMMPGLVLWARTRPERANSADRAVARLGTLVGSVLAGLLIATIGATNALFVDAATFVVSAGLVAFGVPSEASAAVRDEARRVRSYISELVEGIRFVRTNTLILSIIILATVTNFLDVPLVQVILPVYANTLYGNAASLGLILGAVGGGAFIGTLLFGAIGHRLPRRLTFLVSFVIAPILLYGVLALTPSFGVVAVVGLLAGIISGPINPLYVTVIQQNTPHAMLGRVFGTLNAIAQAGIPVGAAAAGLVVDRAGLVPTIVSMGVIYLAVTASMFFNPALRGMDASQEQS